MELLWIVAGVIYIIHKLQSEEHFFTKETVLTLLVGSALIIVPQIIVSLVCDEDNIGTVRPIVSLLCTVLPGLALCIYAIGDNLTEEYNGKKERLEINERARRGVRELREIFEERDFHNISNRMLEELLNNSASPLQIFGVDGINLLRCYGWMCERRTLEIDELNDKELSGVLNIPLNTIPIDESLPIGEAYLRRTLLVKNYLLKKEGLQYRVLNECLQLRYREKYLNEEDEYYAVFSRFINEHTNAM